MRIAARIRDKMRYLKDAGPPFIASSSGSGGIVRATRLMRPWNWTYQGSYPVRIYFNDPRLRIVATEGLLSHNMRWLHHLGARDRLICTIPCFVEPARADIEAAIATRTEIDKSRIWFLCNTKSSTELMGSYGFQAKFINQNIWLDEDLFAPLGLPKRYGALLAVRPMKHKRTHLAAQVRDLAILARTQWANARIAVDLKSLPHAYYGEDLPPSEVSRMMNASYAGLILTSREGASYASSEYLLSGVPVVSTPSDGGREIWYTPQNSVIADPTPEAVAAAVELVRGRTLDGEFTPEVIRAQHLETAAIHRGRFIGLIQSLFDQFGIGADAGAHFSKSFQHKLVTYLPSDEAIALLRST